MRMEPSIYIVYYGTQSTQVRVITVAVIMTAWRRHERSCTPHFTNKNMRSRKVERPADGLTVCKLSESQPAHCLRWCGLCLGDRYSLFGAWEMEGEVRMWKSTFSKGKPHGLIRAPLAIQAFQLKGPLLLLSGGKLSKPGLCTLQTYLAALGSLSHARSGCLSQSFKGGAPIITLVLGYIGTQMTDKKLEQGLNQNPIMKAQFSNMPRGFLKVKLSLEPCRFSWLKGQENFLSDTW